MTWYAVHEISTGKLISMGETVAEDDVLAARGYTKTALAFNPQAGTKRWNAITRLFDDIPPLKPALVPKDFFDRFTAQERSDLFEAAKSDSRATVRKQLQAFVQYVQLAGVVDLNDSYVQGVVNGMETATLIASGRAAVILA